MKAKPTVLFETEGSYPYHRGGVSTWSHILFRELEKDVDFVILALTGNPFMESSYRLPSNVIDVINVPLWGTEEPVQYYNHIPFSEHILRKARTNDQVIEKLFFPLFSDFLDGLFNPFKPAHQFGELFYAFWKYYQHFDYKTTLSSRLLWDEFKNQLSLYFDSHSGISEDLPRVFDVTYGMRWIYHFMMPLAVPIPKVSLTHATLAGFPGISSIIAKYEYGIPILVTDHGIFIRERLINIGQSGFPFFSKKLLIDLSTIITRAVYHHADCIAPVTSVNKRWEMKLEGSENRIQPIYNGIDSDAFRPAAKPARTAEIPTVIAVAQVFPLKDIETMIYSCHLVRRQIPGVQYILYGSLEVDLPYVQKCRELISKLNLENNFIFAGYHDTPGQIFNEGDISILSSISEGIPYTVLESMSCSRPVVSTDVGGIREALEGCGILCKPSDARALAEGVVTLLTNDSLRFEMGQKGRERILKNYTITKTVESYVEIYKNFSTQNHFPLKYNLTVNSVKNLLKNLEQEYV